MVICSTIADTCEQDQVSRLINGLSNKSAPRSAAALFIYERRFTTRTHNLVISYSNITKYIILGLDIHWRQPVAVPFLTPSVVPYENIVSSDLSEMWLFSSLLWNSSSQQNGGRGEEICRPGPEPEPRGPCFRWHAAELKIKKKTERIKSKINNKLNSTALLKPHLPPASSFPKQLTKVVTFTLTNIFKNPFLQFILGQFKKYE